MLNLRRYYRQILSLATLAAAVSYSLGTESHLLDQDAHVVNSVLAQSNATATPTAVPVGESCNDCQYDSEVLMTIDCEDDPGFPHESVFIQLENTGSVSFVVDICLYDFTGTAVTCHKRTVVNPGDTELSIVDGRNASGSGSPPIWKAQAFICEGQGIIRFLEQSCICDCVDEPKPCDSPECFSQEEHDYTFDPCPEPPGHTPGTYFGKQRSKVCLTNSCPFDRTVRYWWEYVSQGVHQINRSGVTVPASSTVCICTVVGLYDAGDGLLQFSQYDLDDCPGILDGVGEPCEIVAEIVTDECCDASGNCTNRLPPHPHTSTPCVP